MYSNNLQYINDNNNNLFIFLSHISSESNVILPIFVSLKCNTIEQHLGISCILTANSRLAVFHKHSNQLLYTKVLHDGCMHFSDSYLQYVQFLKLNLVICTSYSRIKSVHITRYSQNKSVNTLACIPFYTVMKYHKQLDSVQKKLGLLKDTALRHDSTLFKIFMHYVSRTSFSNLHKFTYTLYKAKSLAYTQIHS